MRKKIFKGLIPVWTIVLIGILASGALAAGPLGYLVTTDNRTIQVKEPIEVSFQLWPSDFDGIYIGEGFSWIDIVKNRGEGTIPMIYRAEISASEIVSSSGEEEIGKVYVKLYLDPDGKGPEPYSPYHGGTVNIEPKGTHLLMIIVGASPDATPGEYEIKVDFIRAPAWIETTDTTTVSIP